MVKEFCEIIKNKFTLILISIRKKRMHVYVAIGRVSSVAGFKVYLWDMINQLFHYFQNSNWRMWIVVFALLAHAQWIGPNWFCCPSLMTHKTLNNSGLVIHNQLVFYDLQDTKFWDDFWVKLSLHIHQLFLFSGLGPNFSICLCPAKYPKIAKTLLCFQA